MFLGVSTPHNPKGRDPSVSKIFGTSYMRAHCKRHNNQVLHGEQTVHGRPRMLRRDLFSVANHFNMSWESTLPVQKRNFSHVLNPIETSNTLHDPAICGKFTGFLAGGELAAIRGNPPRPPSGFEASLSHSVPPSQDSGFATVAASRDECRTREDTRP